MQYESGDAAALLSRRRDLSISIIKVELRPYRHTRSSGDITRKPPHFLYDLRLEWSGDSLPRCSSPCGSPPSSPRREPSPSGSPRRPGTNGRGPFEESPSWWDTLPRSYTVKRQWHELVRFHEALVKDLAFDSVNGCNRVKVRIPTLPVKADLDSWTNSLAATGDVCALSRRKPLAPPTSVLAKGILPHHAEMPMNELEDLHWIYVELHLTPYLRDVNTLLRELPTNLLEESVSFRRFALPGSRGAMQKAAYNSNGMPRRFLGRHEPVTASPEDIEAACRQLRRTNPGMFRSSSAASLAGGSGGSGPNSPNAAVAKGQSSPNAAAAKLILGSSSP